MLIKCLPVGQIEANCYIVTDENTLECAIIDPGDESNTIMDYIEDNKLKPVVIMLTHGHYDHTGAAEAVSEETGAPIFINKADTQSENKSEYKYFAPDGINFYSDGDVIEVGSLKFRVLETPGHSPGSVTLRCEDALFTGDTLFRGSCGRTDLDDGDINKLMASLRRLSEIPGDLEVYPGHMDATMLSIERATNQYMRYAKGE
jgi:glyoxylase-like metal-dependent hydrolase (beta-lactamase superfamily II)